MLLHIFIDHFCNASMNCLFVYFTVSLYTFFLIYLKTSLYISFHVHHI